MDLYNWSHSPAINQQKDHIGIEDRFHEFAILFHIFMCMFSIKLWETREATLKWMTYKPFAKDPSLSTSLAAKRQCQRSGQVTMQCLSHVRCRIVSMTATSTCYFMFKYRHRGRHGVQELELTGNTSSKSIART